MIISGKLLTPTGEPMSGTTIRLTATTNSPSVLKGISEEFITDALGDYSIDVPIGRYHVEQADRANRSYRSIGVLNVSTDTQVSDLPTLLMIGQTTAPRDPILNSIEQLVSAAQTAASQASGAVSGIDATVESAINSALENYEFPAGVNGVDGINGVDGVSPVFTIGTVQTGDVTSATITGTQANPVLNLVVQRGEVGPIGPQGLQGVAGPQGLKGDTGLQGIDGINGSDGVDGKSAYQLALDAGFVGTEAAWRISLKGDKGDTGAQGIQGEVGPSGPIGETGPQGIQGPIGLTGPAPDTSTFATKAELNALIKIEQLTQAQYDALPTKDSATLYVIVG